MSGRRVSAETVTPLCAPLCAGVGAPFVRGTVGPASVSTLRDGTAPRAFGGEEVRDGFFIGFAKTPPAPAPAPPARAPPGSADIRTTREPACFRDLSPGRPHRSAGRAEDRSAGRFVQEPHPSRTQRR